jgi:hypothetical protein
LLLGQVIAEVFGTNGRVPQQFAILHANPAFAQTQFATAAGLQMFFWTALIDAFCGSMAALEHLFAAHWHQAPGGQLGLYRRSKSRRLNRIEWLSIQQGCSCSVQAQDRLGKGGIRLYEYLCNVRLRHFAAGSLGH